MNTLQLTSFSFERDERSPEPGARRGLFLHGEAGRLEGGRLHVPLFLTYRVGEPFLGSFRDLARAVVLHGECAAVERPFAAPLVDSEREPLDYAPNHTGNPEGWGNPACCVEGWVNVTLSVALPPDAPSAALYVHASLGEYVSNVVAVDEHLAAPDDDGEARP